MALYKSLSVRKIFKIADKINKDFWQFNYCKQFGDRPVKKNYFQDVYGDECLRETIQEASVTGDIGTLEWISKFNTDGSEGMSKHKPPPLPVTKQEANFAAGKGHLEVLKWFKKECGVIANTEGANWAAGNGLLEVLRWLKSPEGGSVIANTEGANLAAMNSHLEVLRWLKSPEGGGVIADVWGANWAAMNGHLEVLRWLKSPEGGGVTADEDGANEAAEYGYLEVLRWLEDECGVIADC